MTKRNRLWVFLELISLRSLFPHPKTKKHETSKERYRNREGGWEKNYMR